MSPVALQPDRLRERIELLQRCLSMSIDRAHAYANSLSEEDFLEAIRGTAGRLTGVGMKLPDTFPENYFGEFYTIQNRQLRSGNIWERIEADMMQCLTVEPESREVLDYFLNQPEYRADFAGVKARFVRWRNTLDALLGFSLLRKLRGRGKNVTTYALYSEMVPLLRRVLASPKAQDLPVIKSDAAIAELDQVKAMEEEFEQHLKEVVEERLEETLEFGREKMGIPLVTRYLEDLFGPLLYFDVLLALAHQYGMSATEIVNAEGARAGSTGFHLALFGAPGTGKTFAVKDLIMGDESKGVPAHGLPGLNRYCGGMTAANFIRIGEAYQGKRFNFVVTEFNDWFRYKGMVEPLKLALEQGRIRYETKHETVGPYEFSCFFSTNYNTQVTREAGYRVTVSDPNFNAIEDRMLVRMHRMTKQRLRELSRNQRELAMGRLKMGQAPDIRDHLTLVYAIQTGHPLVADRFPRKQVMLREDFFQALEAAQDLLLDQIRGDILFSVRVRQNAMKLAAALTLFSFFEHKGPRLEIPPQARDLAIKFFVEEVAIRQKIGIDLDAVLYHLGLSELSRLTAATREAREDLARAQPPLEAATLIDSLKERTSHELALVESKYAPEPTWEERAESLKKELGGAWDLLDEQARQFLCTGDVLLDQLERLGPDESDYAGVVIEYCKAFELQLQKAIFDPFKLEFGSAGSKAAQELFAPSPRAESLSPSERKALNRTIEVMKRFILGDRPLTLGEMWHILMKLRGPLGASPVGEKLADFLNRSATGPAILRGHFPSLLGRFLKDFRNAAAHTGPMRAEQARACRMALLGGESALLLTLVPTPGRATR